MKPSKRVQLSMSLLVATSLGACGGVHEEEINTQPATLESAYQELDKLDALLSQRPDDSALLAMGRLLRKNMEDLNGVVDRLEIAPDHTVSFYRDEFGISVVELLSQGDEFAVDDKDLSVEEIYAKLAPGRVIPKILRTVAMPAVDSSGTADQPELPQSGGGERAPSSGDIEQVQSALTSEDGPLFRDKYCPKRKHPGDFFDCLPNWRNGGYAYATMRETTLRLAPYHGSMMRVRFTAAGIAPQTFAVFKGEVFGKTRHIVPFVDVPTRDCGWLAPCPTFPMPRKHPMRWDFLSASGDRFHWGYRFTNLGNNRNP